MRRGEATRERVTRTALELFVKKGVKETTIRDIADAAEVAEGTLYRHYESKEALAEALFTESYEAMAATLREIRDDARTFRDALDGMIAVPSTRIGCSSAICFSLNTATCAIGKRLVRAPTGSSRKRSQRRWRRVKSQGAIRISSRR